MEKFLYKAACKRARRLGIPFAPDCEQYPDDRIYRMTCEGVINDIIQSCKYWQRAYREDCLSNYP